eukprot:8287986-Alexandrium_andersonii.AAC.1
MTLRCAKSAIATTAHRDQTFHPGTLWSTSLRPLTTMNHTVLTATHASTDTKSMCMSCPGNPCYSSALHCPVCGGILNGFTAPPSNRLFKD